MIDLGQAKGIIMNVRTAQWILVGGVVALAGCKTVDTTEHTNNELYSQFEQQDHYSQDIQTVDGQQTYEDVGTGIAPATLASIEQTISEVYITDFEHCLEEEMSRLENRWVAGTFTIEMAIETSGTVADVRIFDVDIKERRVADGAAARDAEEFEPCVQGKVADWEFDPPPEVRYVHTHIGRMGEAW